MLERCLSSVLENTYQNLQVLCINDGSKGCSGDLLNKFAAEDVRVTVTHTENHGVSAARNTGLSLATGDYICFIDADDWVHHDYFRILCEKAEAHHADIVISDLKQCSDADYHLCNSELFEAPSYLISVEEAFRNTLTRNRPWGKLFKRDVLGKIRFPEDINFGEDAVFNTLVFSQNREIAVVKVNVPIYFYYVCNEDSLSHNSDVERLYHLAACYLESCQTAERTDFCLDRATRIAMYYRYIGSFSSEKANVKKQASGLLRLCRKQLENDKFMSLKKKIALWVASTSPSPFRLALVMRDPSYVKWEKQIKQK